MSEIEETSDQVKELIKKQEAEIAKLQDLVSEAMEILKPFAVYAEKRDAMPMIGAGDTISQIHPNTVWEAELVIGDCRRACAFLDRTMSW